MKEMKCIALLGALDFFHDCTVPVLEWLKTRGGDGEMSKHHLYARAFLAYAAHRYADLDDSAPPHVGYNPISDTPYFIFKQGNNGSSFVVGEYLPAFPPRMVI